MSEKTTTVSIPAIDLRVGDVVHYNARVSWRVETLTTTTSGKGIVMTGTYTACEFEPQRIGTAMRWTFRVATKLRVTR